jgi:hypothetical protein
MPYALWPHDSSVAMVDDTYGGGAVGAVYILLRMQSYDKDWWVILTPTWRGPGTIYI